MDGTASQEKLIDAIHLVQRHLRSEYIVESCAGERVLGCASCAMTRLHEDLEMLMYEIENERLPALTPSPMEREK